MVGLGWRGNNFGDRITVDADGKQVRTAKGEGPGAGHGKQHAYTVITRDREHPITKGLPQEWMHPQDELYHGQRGPGNNMNILATAFSSKESGGTGDHERWSGGFLPGRDASSRPFWAMSVAIRSRRAGRCAVPGFQAIVTRGTEWAATGEVTIDLPKELPTADKVSLLP